MHAARQGWDLDKDAPLFMNWAIHTGFDRAVVHYIVFAYCAFCFECIFVGMVGQFPIVMSIMFHAGKYRPGIDKPDPKTWKANFRCAMNSLPDIEEVKDKSIKRGSNAFRMYRMLTPTEKAVKKGKLKHLKKHASSWRRTGMSYMIDLSFMFKVMADMSVRILKNLSFFQARKRLT